MDLSNSTAVRIGHQSRDQHKHKSVPWSVHGGDHFAAVFSSPEKQRASRKGLKRSVSFRDGVDEVVVSKSLCSRSVFRAKLNKEIVPIEATAEATWLIRSGGGGEEEDDVGFAVDGESNVVTSVDGDVKGSLRPGDRIVAVDGRAVEAGTSVLTVLPSGRRFVHFDVVRELTEAVEEEGPPRLSKPRSFGSFSSGLSSLASMVSTPRGRSRSNSTGNLQALDRACGDEGAAEEAMNSGGTSSQPAIVVLRPFVVACDEALAYIFDADNSLLTTSQPPHAKSVGGGGGLGSLASLSEDTSTAEEEEKKEAAEREEVLARLCGVKGGGKPKVGDVVISIDGTPLKSGESARDRMAALHAQRKTRRGGLSRNQPRVFTLVVRRREDEMEASPGSSTHSGALGKLKELKYSAWRELDTRRTSLCYAGKEHRVALELARDLSSALNFSN